MRKTPFINGEYYHIYNRGTDKRNIFSDEKDMVRFFKSMIVFNCVDGVRSIRDIPNISQTSDVWEVKSEFEDKNKMIEFVAFCLNPNHFHFILRQIIDGGISEFMKRLGGYTKYFNEKHKRSGVLFQGKFKSIHINSNEYLLYLSAYVNLNDRVHFSRRRTSESEVLSWSSRSEYGYNDGIDDNIGLCSKDIILSQFKDKEGYKKFCTESMENILNRKYQSKNMEKFLLE